MRQTMTKHIKVSGQIVDNDTEQMFDFFGMECTSPKMVDSILNDDDNSDPDIDTDTGDNEPEDVVVDIASNGGDVSAGSQIYTALRSYQGNVIVNVVGLAASAASVIAMAGDKVRMSPTSQLMIHKAMTSSYGNADDMNKVSSVLSKVDQSIASAYQAKTGMKQIDVLKMMQDETWMTADDAVRLGFADEIMFSNDDDNDADADDPDTDDGNDVVDQLQFAAATTPVPRKDKVDDFIKMMKMMDFLKSESDKSQHSDSNKTIVTKSDTHKSLTQQKLDSLLND